MRQRFIIVCEGEKTEFAYFKAFQVPTLVIKIRPIGRDPLTLVQEAKKYTDRSPERYDQTWCVFDRDDFPPERIRLAIQEAETKSYKLAISNQSFELWYILHFEFLCTAISRQDYMQKLQKLLNGTYTKNDPDMYRKLENLQGQAIQHAQRLLEQYSPWDPISCDPSTTVHCLVKELNRHRRP